MPEALIVEHQIVVVYQELRNEGPAAAGIAVLAVFEAKIFLRKRLEREFRKTHPGGGELSACLSNFKAQPPDGQRVGGRAPAQVNVDCSPLPPVFRRHFQTSGHLGP